ncbi:ferritin-like domain-containing protein [Microcoleus sp.]|uniref:ferritin-like domain-containing protein n=1 Tax=Microcoleus sp. TaxID=44472 RepID=UPI0035940349
MGGAKRRDWELGIGRSEAEGLGIGNWAERSGGIGNWGLGIDNKLLYCFVNWEAKKLRYTYIGIFTKKHKIMTVAYPRKLRNAMGAREILAQVVRDREIHLITLNRYRFSEQRSCKDLTDLIEQLDGEPAELVRDLSRHISDEARHAMWLTDLLVDLGQNVGKPPGVSYIDEFERLFDSEQQDPTKDREDFVISSLAAINVTEKRGCEYFSAHIHALKKAPQTDENVKIRETIEKIFPEEAGHVRWGNRWLGAIAAKSPEHRQKVEQAKRKYVAIEQAAFESGMDIMLGAELRRVTRLVDIANTMPMWERPQYLMERLPATLLAPDLQMTRVDVAQRAWNRDPQAFVEKFVPMFLNGMNNTQKKPQTTKPRSAVETAATETKSASAD